MKRKRLILTTVLLVCVAAVAVPLRREIWLAVAYEKHYEQRMFPGLHTMYFLAKRPSWLPGSAYIFPPQVCNPCFSATETDWPHSDCYITNGNKIVAVRSPQIDGGIAVFPKSEFTCTCPEPSHEWNR